MAATQNSYLSPEATKKSREYGTPSLMAALTKDEPKRSPRHLGHPALSILFGFLVVTYSFTASVNLAVLLDAHGTYKLQQVYPQLPYWVVPCATLLAALNVAWLMSMLHGRKLGFYGFVGTSLAMATVQILALGSPLSSPVLDCLRQCSLTILWPVLTLWLLRSGGPRSVWSQFD